MDSPSLSSATLSEVSDYELVDADAWSIASSDDLESRESGSPNVSEPPTQQGLGDSDCRDRNVDSPDVDPSFIPLPGSEILPSFDPSEQLIEPADDGAAIQDSSATQSVESSGFLSQDSQDTPLEFNLAFPDPWHSSSVGHLSSSSSPSESVSPSSSMHFESPMSSTLFGRTLPTRDINSADSPEVLLLSTISVDSLAGQDELEESKCPPMIPSLNLDIPTGPPTKETTISLRNSPLVERGRSRVYRIIGYGTLVFIASCILLMAFNLLYTTYNQDTRAKVNPGPTVKVANTPTPNPNPDRTSTARTERPSIQVPPLRLDGAPHLLLLESAPESIPELSRLRGYKDQSTSLERSASQQAISRYVPPPPALCHGSRDYTESLKATLDNFLQRLSTEAPVASTALILSSRHKRAKRNAKAMLKHGRQAAQKVGEFLF